MENQFLVDSAHLSGAALEKKHRLEHDPAFRKDPMEYLPGMEQINSELRQRVLAQMEDYDASAYTAGDVRAALAHETCSVEDFKALLSPAAEPMCISSRRCISPITARITACTAASTVITISGA